MQPGKRAWSTVLAVAVVCVTSLALSAGRTPARADTPLTVTMAIIPNSPAIPGTQETLEAFMSPGTVPGTATFYDGNTVIAVLPDYEALATITEVLPEGSHSLSVTFTPNGPGTVTSTSQVVSYVVGTPTQSTSTALKVTPGALTVGATATLTATVAPEAATGTVTFSADGSVLGSSPVDGGQAALSTQNLALGSHTLTATFAPFAPTYTGSTSSPVTVTVASDVTVSPTPTVSPIATSLTLSASPDQNVVPGETVTLTAVVTPRSAQGTVRFIDNGRVIGTAPLVGGSASLLTKAVAGSHDITAEYLPATSQWESSSSSGLALAVQAPGSSTVSTTVGGSTAASTGTRSGATGTLPFTGAFVVQTLEASGALLALGSLLLTLGYARRRPATPSVSPSVIPPSS